MNALTAKWIQLKRLVGIDPATPLDSQEGQLRYQRSSDSANGLLYLARRTSGGTMEWLDVTAYGIAPLVAVDYRDSASANVTSTTGSNLSSLAASVTLTSGKTWDLFFEGSINANADPTGYIFAGCSVDGDVFGWTDTGTASGERALGFAGYKLGVAGDDAAHTANCRMKVDTGTGTINAGWCKLTAIAR